MLEMKTIDTETVFRSGMIQSLKCPACEKRVSIKIRRFEKRSEGTDWTSIYYAGECPLCFHTGPVKDTGIGAIVAFVKTPPDKSQATQHKQEPKQEPPDRKFDFTL